MTPYLMLTNTHKSFGAIKALRGASLNLYAGEVHALLGENGAGKSTLVKILAGVHQADKACFEIDGKPQKFYAPLDARKAGIAIIYQEPTLFPDLNIAENIFMGRQPKGALGNIDYSKMNQEVRSIMQRLEVNLSPQTKVDGLSIADQQVIEIAKALSLNAKILIMDEPTAALSLHEVERLFVIVRQLRLEGVAILLITHRLEEVFAETTRITIMRDGAFISEAATQDLTTDALIKLMVGRDLEDYYPERVPPSDVICLEVNNLSRQGIFKDINFQVKAGEILALAGLVGSGRSEIVRAIFGIDHLDTGEIYIDGVKIYTGDVQKAMEYGIALVPEDRRQQGLALDLSIDRNIGITVLSRISKYGFMPSNVEYLTANDWAKKLQLKSNALTDAASTLSGGNQQKVVLGKWLATAPKVLLIDEPTRGIDVGAKAEVYKIMADLAQNGIAIVMVSSELPEVIGMADRVLVICEGQIQAQLAKDELSEARILEAALPKGHYHKESQA